MNGFTIGAKRMIFPVINIEWFIIEYPIHMKDTVYKLKKDLVVQQVNEEVFIFDGETSILHTLNETAADLFKKLKKGAAVSELVDYLIEEYGITRDKALKDSGEFVEKLKKKKLVIEKKSKESSHA